MKRALEIAMALLVAGFAAPVLAQAPPGPEDDAVARIRRRVELVVVPVTVKDRHGRLVHDIRREEFRVLEDGEEREIAVFSADAFPLSVVILVDNDLRRSAAKDVERSAAAIAAGLGSDDEATVMLFDQLTSPPEEFVRDNNKLHDRLRRLKLNETFPGMGSAPMTAGPRVNQQSQATGVPALQGREPKRTKNLHDAIWAAGQLLRQSARERRKIIFLISDGRNSRNNQFSFDDTLHLLLASDISVYAISVEESALKPGGELESYARATGGDVYLARSRRALEGMYARVTEQARHQYTLAYVPHPADPTRDYHEIEVRVRRPRLRLLARDGYYTAVP